VFLERKINDFSFAFFFAISLRALHLCVQKAVSRKAAKDAKDAKEEK